VRHRQQLRGRWAAVQQPSPAPPQSAQAMSYEYQQSNQTPSSQMLSRRTSSNYKYGYKHHSRQVLGCRERQEEQQKEHRLFAARRARRKRYEQVEDQHKRRSPS